ncbi:Na(+)/glucose symporter [Limihaloglobus sulfuriphilus]|uniref:Na(+)/glucose symporter n=1 Tax=Limihaloglobus sulfuriphilus TaxID=1851148 RepID=A0A1Q2MEB2_9BACT|nr:sodium:solute symporter [Limihaloglobus sulfuriphilus]AQQ71036.1 Na(+)/glucose symporter [Limihaloglobus sulfuriphilus]
MNLSFYDWLIVSAALLFIVFVARYTTRYVQSVSDFLAASRSAGKYLLCISQGAASVGAITVVGMFEMYYQAGFTGSWWTMITSPLLLLITVSGWVTYRFRETRAYTVAELFERRYSRGVRIFAGMLGWFSGILNFGIFPAVGARFLIHFCGLPTEIPYLPIDTFPLIMLILLSVGLLFVFTGGQVTIMVTDFVQGLFTNIVLIIMAGFFFYRFNWDIVFDTLKDAPVDSSMINPFKTEKIKDFNPSFFIITAVSLFYVRNAWQGAQGYAASAKNAHEAKLGSMLGEWRGLILTLLLMILPVGAYVVMHNTAFSSIAEPARAALSNISDDTIRRQLTVPVVLSKLFPRGIMGLFVSVMLMACISTYSTYLHSWGSIFIQDIIMPFRREPFSKKQHMILLKFSVLFVAVFVFLFSLLFSQKEYILMFLSITASIFVGGAGSLMIGGLYWKRGTSAGAYSALVIGLVISIGSMVLRQMWVPQIYPWLDSSAPALLANLKFVIEGVAARIPGANWVVGPDEFPINSQWIFFFTILSAIAGYVLVSLIDGIVFKRPAYNLEKLLHRGDYAVKDDHARGVTKPAVGIRALLPSSEFSFSDKLIYYFKLSWCAVWFTVFIAGVIINLSTDVAIESWMTFWKIHVTVIVTVGIGTTIWFCVGGIKDLGHLFSTLKELKRDESDTGFVSRSAKQ